MRSRTRWRWFVALLTVLGLLAGCTSPSTEPQPVGTPSPVDLEKAVADYISNGPEVLGTVNSVVVEVDGVRKLELYRNGGGPDHYSHVWSVTKSVVSTLVGIAIAEGKISSLDAKLAELLPDHAAAMTKDQRGITLRQLLTMSAGISDQRTGPWLHDAKVASILKLPLQSPPGTQFAYSDPSAQLVSAIVAEATGTGTLEYARAKLFTPLGIRSTPAYTPVASWDRIGVGAGYSKAFDTAGFAWAMTEDRVSNGCCMLKLTADDMQKIGRLFLDGGRWDDQQVVPAEWVRQATTASETTIDYGLFWWLENVGGRQAFAAEGRGGQLIAVVPETRTVITVSTTPAPDLWLEPEDVIYMVNRVIVSWRR